MGKLNRGEWSEIYTILSLLLNPNLEIDDHSLNTIRNDLYILKEITIRNPKSTGRIKYVIKPDEIEVRYDNGECKKLEIDDIVNKKEQIYKKIKSAPVGGGSFSIPIAKDLLNNLTMGNPIKSKSFSKSDLDALVNDTMLKKDVDLSYSIKSSIGSPATVLNASKSTNFLYSVEGLNKEYIKEINSIKTRTKLLDKINFIRSHGGVIKFEKVCDEILDYNLKLIDSNMPTYLGNVLLNSYTINSKDLKNLFITSNQFDDETFALKKLGDLLDGISFGLFPSVKWNGKNSVNGGLLIVKKDGDVVILDLIYYKDEVLKYLIEETKLDSPSSTRYDMLNLYEKDGKIYFTLNLQIRYKR